MRLAPFFSVLLVSSSGLASPPGPELAPAPWSLAVDGVAGIGVLFTGARNDAHPMLGGLARARIGLFELGGYGDWTPHQNDDSSAVGGIAGAFLPYRRWLDFELAGTFGRRRFGSTDQRYGPTGYTLQEWAAGGRVGVSARAGSLFAVRVGAMLALATGLKSHELTWQWAADDAHRLVTTGTRHIGGTDVMLIMTIGLDVTPPH